MYKWYNNKVQQFTNKEALTVLCSDVKRAGSGQSTKEVACAAGAKRAWGGGGRKVRNRGIKREGSACYKNRCFCISPTIFSTNPITSTVKRDLSQVEGFSAWTELNYMDKPEIVKSRRLVYVIS